MHLSLRSPMMAGTTAFLGASAIALTPMAPAVPIAALSAARTDVALAALANPITALIGTAGVAGAYLLDPGMAFNPPTVGAGAINWPFAGISDLMNSYLQFEGLGGYVSVGILPQIVADSFPIATALVQNGLDYIWNTVEAVGIAGAAIGDTIWSIPTTAIAVAQDLLTFDIQAAVADISAAISSAVSDIETAGTALLGAGTYVVTGVVTRAAEVLATLVGQLPLAVIETVRQISQVVTSIADAGQAIVSSLASLDPETIWNTAVANLLSPAGIPGVLLNVTLGAGVQLGPVTTQESIAENFVFSTRTVIQGAVKAIAGALNTPNPAPPASAAEVSPAEVRAAAVQVEAGPSAQAAPSADTADITPATSAADARVVATDSAAGSTLATLVEAEADGSAGDGADRDSGASASTTGKASAHKVSRVAR